MTQLDVVADRISELIDESVYRGQAPDIPCIALIDSLPGGRPSNVNLDYDYPSFQLVVRGTDPATVITDMTTYLNLIHLDRHSGGIVSMLCGLPDLSLINKTYDHARLFEATASLETTIRRVL